MNSKLALCTLNLHLPESHSLKDKRSTIKSITKRLHNTFNLSVAEVDKLDKWQLAVIAMVIVSNDFKHSERVVRQAITYIEEHYPHVQILDEDIELI